MALEPFEPDPGHAGEGKRTLISQPLDILPRHYRWTVTKLLDHCSQLDDESFHRVFPIGLGSLHDTIRHMIQCVRSWVARVKGERPERAATRLTIAELRNLLEISFTEIESLINAYRDRLDKISSEVFEEAGSRVTVRFTAGAAVTHCLVHTSYHAAQCVNMLRQLDAPRPLPELDVMDFFVSTEPEAESKE